MLSLKFVSFGIEVTGTHSIYTFIYFDLNFTAFLFSVFSVAVFNNRLEVCCLFLLTCTFLFLFSYSFIHPNPPRIAVSVNCSVRMCHWIVHHRQHRRYARLMLDEIRKYVKIAIFVVRDLQSN